MGICTKVGPASPTSQSSERTWFAHTEPVSDLVQDSAPLETKDT